MRYFSMRFAMALLLAGTAHAQPLDMSNEAFRRAAVTLVLVDHAADVCQQKQGFTPDDRLKTAAWQNAHSVDKIRTRLNELLADAQFKQSVDRIKVSASAKFRGTVDACKFFRAALRSPEAQFARSAPDVVASLDRPDARAPAKPKTSAAKEPPSAAGKPSGKANSTAAILAQVDSIGFDFRAIAGYGGVVMDTYPVVLFRNGDLLMDVTGLAAAGGLEAHKRSQPDEWEKWRRSGGKLQRKSSDGWRDLGYQVSYPKLPDGFKLNGRFHSSSGVGTGAESVIAWRQYRFLANGQVEREAGVGSTSEVANSTTVSKTVAPNRRGTYRVEGLSLRIAYDDGSNESYILVTDPKNPRAIWLDGVGYTQSRK
jgi:hypothetical protein